MSRTIEIILGVVSIAMVVGSLAAIPWSVRRLPVDYFVRPPQPHSLARKIAQNGAGVTLIALGVAMLVLPGQGVITILLGLALLDVPIKRRMLARLLREHRIRSGLQALRTKLGKPPLAIPTTDPT